MCFPCSASYDGDVMVQRHGSALSYYVLFGLYLVILFSHLDVLNMIYLHGPSKHQQEVCIPSSSLIIQ